jgi:hypothetical protein
MFQWSNNNRACSTLWSSLFTMHELNTNFVNSGTLTMQDLTFYNPLSSADLRNQEANDIANHLDTVFITGRGAKYQSGVDQSDAVSKMAAILSDGTKTLTDLASTAHDCYSFFGE